MISLLASTLLASTLLAAQLVDLPARDRLEDAGIGFAPLLVGDIIWLPRQEVVSGLGIFEPRVRLDLDALLGWRGLSLQVAPLIAFGGAPSARLGDVQVIDNVEAPSGVVLFEAFAAGRFSPLELRLGFIDLNRIIDVVPGSALFIHSTAGYGAVLGNLRPNGGLSFPSTTLTAAASLAMGDWRFTLLLADGVPGSGGVRPPRTTLRLGGGDGLLSVAEAEWVGWGEWAVGAWASTTDYGPSRGRGGAGGWASFSLPILPDGPSFGGATLFFRTSLGTPDASLFSAGLGGGLVFRGLAGAADQLGFAAFSARGSEVPQWETAYELTYQADLGRGFRLQPFLTWVDQALAGDGGPALGLRLELAL